MKDIHRKKRGLWKIALAVVFSAVLAGCSSTAISQTQATEIAFEHAGVTQEETVSLSVSKDRENGVEVYDIQFSTESRAYHYDIARNSGEIVNYSYDGKAASPGTGGNQNSQTEISSSSSSSFSKTETTSQENSSSTASSRQQTSSSSAAAVTEEQAKQIALEHAGLSEGEVTFYRVEQDFDDGQKVYEVEFYSGNTEYDYKISQDTGKVLSSDSDIEGWAPNTQTGGTSNAVTLEQATQLVLERIPGATMENVRIKAERDDGRDIYEGEVYYDRAEYEFEIDAYTGNFIEWSVDYQD